MSQQGTFRRIISSLNEAMLNDTHWPQASRLIDEVCGSKGNALFFGKASSNTHVEIYLTKCCYRGDSRPDQMHEYLKHYHAADEHVPRMRRLPHGKIVPIAEQFTEEERKRSRCYNEAYSRYDMQNALEVRLDEPGSAHIALGIADPVDSIGWSTSRVEMIARLLPHIRQYVRVHSALAEADALGASMMKLLDNTRAGIIQLDRRGLIVNMNDKAAESIRKNDGLSCRANSLIAVQPTDQSKLSELLARALPRYEEQARSGSMVIRQSSLLPMLALHVIPVSGQDECFRSLRIAALILLMDPMDGVSIDPNLVEELLGLSPKEARIAVMLAEGQTLRQIAVMTGRGYNTLRYQLHLIFTKLGISRQVELIQIIHALSELPTLKN